MFARTERILNQDNPPDTIPYTERYLVKTPCIYRVGSHRIDGRGHGAQPAEPISHPGLPDRNHAVYRYAREGGGQLVARIDQTAEDTACRPLVFVTLVDDGVREIINSSQAVVFDLFATFIGPMETELAMESSHSVGKSHGVSDMAEYTSRISAVHFSMATDDGLETDHYNKADIILVGVSRCGKTPTSLYLALHYGFFASNYPLTEVELKAKKLPAVLEGVPGQAVRPDHRPVSPDANPAGALWRQVLQLGKCLPGGSRPGREYFSQ